MVPLAVKSLDLVEIVYSLENFEGSIRYEFLHVVGQLNERFKHLDSFASP